jgi:hypothetical protein
MNRNTHTAHGDTNHELAHIRTRVNELAERLADAAEPVRLLVLDATTADTLNDSIDELTSDDYVTLAAAVATAHRRQHEQDTLAQIRAVIENEAPDTAPAVGVLFTAEQHHSGYYLGAAGTVVFGDGHTSVLEFEDVEEMLRELYEDVDPEATLAVDLRTNTFDFAYRRPHKPITVHTRFGVAEPSYDDRILTIVRDTLAGDYKHDGDGDLDGHPIGVQFKSRPEENGHFLSSDNGFVLFDSGDVAIVTFPDIANTFAKAVGRVGSMHSLIVDLRGEGLVVQFENDLTPMTARFDLTD